MQEARYENMVRYCLPCGQILDISDYIPLIGIYIDCPFISRIIYFEELIAMKLNQVYCDALKKLYDEDSEKSILELFVILPSYWTEFQVHVFSWRENHGHDSVPAF